MGSGKKGKPADVIDQDTVFANVPSRTEVGKAISGHQSVLYAKMGSGKMGKPAAVIDLDTFFANVPSRTEVEKAISELQSFLDGDAGSFPQSSECNRLIQMLNNDEITQSSGYRRVQEAFHLLKTDSAVRKVGLSISSDKAVWDAVLSNKAVQDLRGSLKQAGISDEELDWAATILRWILKITTAIFGEIMEKLVLLIHETFQKAKVGNLSPEVVKNFDGRLETLLLLSIVILIIVVVTSNGDPGKKGIPAAVIDLDTVFAKAISELQRWPSVNRRVQKAFHLLKKDSTVRELVFSIVSDEAVWDAVLRNKAVQDLLKQAGISDKVLGWAATSLWWILKITMALVTSRRNSDF